MRTEEIVKQGVGVVGAIITSFGGFLLNVAPPSNSAAKFPVGIASLVLLFVFLLTRFTLHYRWRKDKRLKIWLISSVSAFIIFVAGFYFYYNSFQNDVFTFGDVPFAKGSVLTDDAEIIKKSLVEEATPFTDERLVKAFGNPKKNVAVLENVWTKKSLDDAKFRLVFLYILMIVGIGSAILSLTTIWSDKSST